MGHHIKDCKKETFTEFPIDVTSGAHESKAILWVCGDFVESGSDERDLIFIKETNRGDIGAFNDRN